MAQIPVSILIVDDEVLAEILADRFASMGHEVDVAKNGRDGLAKILENHPDIVFLDLHMPEMDGMEVLDELDKHDFKPTIVVLTAHGTIPRAVQAMRSGAYDFVTKPVQMADIDKILHLAIERHLLQTEKASLAQDISRQYGEIVTKDPRFLSLIGEAEKAAETDSTVLLLGESGTGKELFARRIHALSPRRERSFVAVNSVAIPETLFESELFGYEKGAFTGADRQKKGKLETAQGGTLFLDEIGDLSEPTQGKLLRVLQDGEYSRVGGVKTLRADIRIIAATNRDLKTAVDAGRFRTDLYFRLAVLTFRLLPLRERPKDIPLLADHFLRQSCQDVKREEMKLSDEAMDCFQAYGWPGNVRELRNVIERIAVLVPDDQVGLDYLPEEILSTRKEGEDMTESAGGPDPVLDGYHRAVRNYQRWLIEQALVRCGGKHNKAAELLGLNRTYLSRLRTQLGVR